MSAMHYRDYAARVEYDADDRIFVGHIADIRDIVGFHGATVDELETAFHEAVDDYLAMCQTLGQAPDKPASDNMMPRVPPEVQRSCARSPGLRAGNV